MLTYPTRHDLREFVASLQPYTFVTIALNQKWRDPSGARQKLKQLTKDLALRLDQRFLKSHHVTRYPASRRFDAIVLPEKLAGNPHIHMAFFAPEQSSHDERVLRRTFLFRNVATETNALSDHDRLSAFVDEVDAEQCRQNSVLSELSRSLTGHVSSIHRTEGLAWYLTKEYNIVDAEFWFLQQFHSSRTPSDWQPPK